MSDNIIELKDDNFDEALTGAEKPVLVDFWAEWCGPCKALAPILEEIAEEHKDSITVAKVNVDDSPTLAQRYGVMSIPTLIRFEEGEQKQTLVGAASKNEILQSLDLS